MDFQQDWHLVLTVWHPLASHNCHIAFYDGQLATEEGSAGSILLVEEPCYAEHRHPACSPTLAKGCQEWPRLTLPGHALCCCCQNVSLLSAVQTFLSKHLCCSRRYFPILFVSNVKGNSRFPIPEVGAFHGHNSCSTLTESYIQASMPPM